MRNQKLIEIRHRRRIVVRLECHANNTLQFLYWMDANVHGANYKDLRIGTLAGMRKIKAELRQLDIDEARLRAEGINFDLETPSSDYPLYYDEYGEPVWGYPE